MQREYVCYNERKQVSAGTGVQPIRPRPNRILRWTPKGAFVRLMLEEYGA
jgi:hypothetical protein